MKLIHQVTVRISITLMILLSVWAVVFYFIIIDEINDETDDSLEDYAEYIITRALAGESLPSADNGTNNSYHITEVTPDYAQHHDHIRYFEEMIYIGSKGETEPARILKTIFRNDEGRYFELTVSIPTIEKEDLQETILWWIIFLYVGLLLAVIAINLWVLYRSFRPLYTLLKWLDQYVVGKEMIPLSNNTRVTEFRRLNDAIIRSAVRNNEMYDQQKLFIANASHELQTPLAVCLNRLEMLFDDPGLNEKQLEEMGRIQETLDHIIKLNKSLLLLSKIDNGQFPDQEKINVNDLIKKLLADYREVYGYRNISVDIREESIITIDMNRTLASVMMGNLLKNAFVHNHDNGSVLITIRKRTIIFSNTGTAGPLPSDGIFKRFYQGTKKEGSSGLGLALVESISKLYHIRLTYRFMEDRHTFMLEIS